MANSSSKTGADDKFTNPGYLSDVVGDTDSKQEKYISGVSYKKRPEDSTDRGSTKSEDGGLDDVAVHLTASPDAKAMQQPRVYKRRWVMLGLFCLYSFSNSFQWIHLNIITNIMLQYYNESLPGDSYQQETAVDWLSMIYMLAYIPLIFPATYLMDKKGLRICIIVGSFLNALGAWLKCASASPDRFGVLMFAQTICAIAQLWVLETPPRLAAVWFGPTEVSTATSIGVFGNQVGAAIGFLVPPEMVPKSDNLDEIGDNLSIMYYMTAGVTTAIFIIMVVGYQNTPPTPPSRAQLLAIEAAPFDNYFRSLLRMMTNWGFVLLFISYGVNTGCYYAIATLMNPVVLHYFPNEELNAGRIGLTVVLTGIVGAILAGIWLDRTRTFKGTSLGIYICSMLGLIAFTFTMNLEKIWIVFITAGTFGFFMTGYLPVGFEFAAELTFPESEGTSSGLLNASAQTFGIIFTLGMRAMMNRVNVRSANITVCVALLVGSIMTAVIRADYRRQEAGKEVSEKTINIEKPTKDNKPT